MANKKGPLSKVEIFYVEQHHKAGKAAQDIANDLGRAVHSVESLVAKISQNTKGQVNHATHGFHHSGGATIMTESASAIGDARSKSRASNKLNVAKPCVTTVKKHEDE